MKRLSFKVVILGADALLVGLAFFIAYLVRFDFDIWPEYRVQLFLLMPFLVLIRVTMLYYFSAYQIVWDYMGLSDLIRLGKAILAGAVLIAVVDFFRNYSLGAILVLAFFISTLFHRRIFHLRRGGKLFVGVAVAACLAVLLAAVLVFTLSASAPVGIGDVYLGSLIADLEFHNQHGIPRVVLVVETVLSFLMIGGLRLSRRIITELRTGHNGDFRNVLIYGAGDIGETLVRAMRSKVGLDYAPAGFIDDDPIKQRVQIHGVPVLGTRKQLADVLERTQADELLIALPSITDSDLREIAMLCLGKQIPVRRVPGLSSLLDPNIRRDTFETVQIEDLLGRSEVHLDPAEVEKQLRDKVVLVTGAGGSIGTELCRQISSCGPRLLVILGKGENSIFEIQSELTRRFPELETVSVIADVQDLEKIEHVLRNHQPHVVYHAAAYKHVSFMEQNPEEAVCNNVLGTRNLAAAAVRNGVGQVVLISSDKAVYPSSVMGASKKLAEQIVQHYADRSDTQFVSVRFGNVLRSRGSIVPIFERQIEEGGPVTVTDARMTRYFMSIPEAVRLVLHSGVIAKSGDLCVLDMGEQVNILKLAEYLITMAGKKPHAEIEIAFIGARPGEKLAEELLTEAEARRMRRVEKIMVCEPECFDRESFDASLDDLIAAGKACQRAAVLDGLKTILPAFNRSSDVAD